MESADVCPDVSISGGKKVKDKNTNIKKEWHKRLRFRKAAVQPRTMQSRDKRGPNKITEGWEQNTKRPSLRKSPQKAQQCQRGTRDRGHVLRFRCSQCKVSSEYGPDDLMKHFQESHRGSSPVFPCHMCPFSTHEFSWLQVHLISHMDAFSSCNICNDNVKRAPSEFETHLTMHHSLNGKYLCKTCEEFSTRDVRVFLEHLHLHNVALEKGSNIDHARKDFQRQLRSKTITLSFHCHLCSYEAPNKRLITKHMNTVHAGQNGTQGLKEVHPIIIKPNDVIPRVKHRMTRKTVREMQECLSLQDRDLLGKYCSLSDPEKNLEEEFLMRTTAGETGGQKWTKALQTVLSNVPQDTSPKSDNSITSNSGFPNTSKDLAVLTVKNKITVPQNGTADAKGFKMMTPSEKHETIPSETATVDTHCIFDTNRCQSSLNDQTHCPGAQIVLNDASISAQNEFAECSQTQDNRENQEVKINQDNEEHRRTYEEPKHSKPCEDGTDASKELRLKNKRGDRKAVSKARPKKTTIRRRWNRKTRRKADKGASGLGLKLVLKKDPVKDKQWMSQSSLCLLGGGLLGDYRKLPQPQSTLEETQLFLQRALSAENGQKKWTKATTTDQHVVSKVIAPTLPTEKTSKPEKELFPHSEHLSTSGDDLDALMVKNKISIPPNCTTKPTGIKIVDGKKLLVLKVVPSTRQGIQDKTEQLLRPIEAEIDSGKTCQSEAENPLNTSTNNCPENVSLQNSGTSYGAWQGNDNDMASCVSNMEEGSLADDDMTPRGNCGAKSYPVLQSPIAPWGKTDSEDSGPTVSSLEKDAQNVTRGTRKSERHSPELSRGNGHSNQTIQEEASSAPVCQWRPAPRSVERTLKLIPVSPTQLVKHPVGEQPVVVLNHPDADIPEVTGIMEVVHRYNGEVQKVVLSCKTLNALSATAGETPGAAADPTDTRSSCSNSVKERFILKLKLKRMSRKKYQVVKASSDSDDLPVRFRCWFCGRAFASRQACRIHGQRHVMEWERPNCENS